MKSFDDKNELWVEKYKPKEPKDILGNGENIKILRNWLLSWHEKNTKEIQYNKMIKLAKERGEKVNKKRYDPMKKAVLISGPPGIGKSTAAGIISKSLGFDIMELNASDTRSKKILESELGGALSTGTIRFNKNGIGFASSFQSNNNNNNNNISSSSFAGRVIIMDEVDGMSGSDRGGIQALIKLLKSSKTPVICICNDRHSAKIRSLVNYCIDLKFKRPGKIAIANRLIEIGKLEKITIDKDAGTMLAESCGNDIRQCINTLQLCSTKSNNITKNTLENEINTIKKDAILRVSPFDAVMMILKGKNGGDFWTRYNAYFVDYSLEPLMIQQNYIRSLMNNRESKRKMPILSQISDSISDLDLLSGNFQTGMDWSLLPYQACTCVRAGYLANGYTNWPDFPQWLGKYSTTNKKKRLSQEIVDHLNFHISGSHEEVRLSYIPTLRYFLLKLLIEDKNINDAVHLLDTYGLSRDDFMENMSELLLDIKSNKYTYNKIETKTKAAFTRLWKKERHLTQALVSDDVPNKKKKKKTLPIEDVDVIPKLDGDEGSSLLTTIDEEEEIDEEKEDEEFIKQFESKKKNNKKKSKSKKN